MSRETNQRESNILDFKKPVIKYILNNLNNKIPIKKSDIVALVLNGNEKLFSPVMDLVKSHLKDIGFNLIEVPNVESPSYICVSKFSLELLFEYTTEQKSQISLLFIILSCISMKEVNEANLFNFLEKFNIKVDEQHRFYGSNLRKLITDVFVEQLYLKKEKKDNDEILYSWGYRSTMEFPKQESFKKNIELMEKLGMYFTQQHNEVYNRNENNSQKQQ